MLTSFHVPAALQYGFFQKWLFMHLSTFNFFLLFWIEWAFYIFWVFAVHGSYHLNISPHSVGCLFVWLMVSFNVQMFLHLIWSYLLYDCFCFPCLIAFVSLAETYIKSIVPIFSPGVLRLQVFYLGLWCILYLSYIRC